MTRQIPSTPAEHIEAGDAEMLKSTWGGNTPQNKLHFMQMAQVHYAAATAKLLLGAEQERLITYEQTFEGPFDEVVAAVKDVVAAHKKKEGDDGGS